MANKLIALILFSLALEARADDRLGTFDILRFPQDDQTQSVSVKAPDSGITPWTLTLPGDNGDPGQVLQTDGDGNLSWATISVNPLVVDSSKTTTDSEAVNRVRLDWDPTDTGDNVTALDVSADIGTDENVNVLAGLNVQVAASQNGATNELNGFNVVTIAGTDDNATTVGSVQPNRTYVEIQDQTTVTNSLTLHGDGVNADAGSAINQFNGMLISGNIQGSVTGFQGLSVSQDVGEVGSYTGLNFSGNVGLTGGMNVLNVNYNLTGAQDENTGYYLINEGSTLGALNSYVGYGGHPQITSIRGDFNTVEGSANVGTVGRNVNALNLHNTFTSVNGFYNGISDSSDFGTLVGGSANNAQLNFKGSVPGDAYGIGIYPQVTQRGMASQIIEVTVEPDVAGSLSGKYFRMCSAYIENPNECVKVWHDVDNGSTPPSADGDTLVEVDIATGDTAATIAAAEAAAIDALAKFNAEATDDKLEITVVAQGRAGGMDAGNIGWDWTFIQGGGGDGTFRGISFGGGSLVGYDESHIVAFDSGGYPVNFGRVNAFTNYNIVASPENPTTVHNMGANFNVANSQTVTDGDAIGVGGIGMVTVGDGSTVTSGALGVGATSQGKIGLLTIGTGSSIQNTTSDLAAQIFVAGSGTIQSAVSYRALVANFGATGVMENYRAFLADDLTGQVAVNQWGLYAKPSYQNYMACCLKIGGAMDGSNDKIVSANAGLEIDGKHIHVMGDAPTPTVNANAGTGSACTVSGNDTAGVIFLTTANDGVLGVQCDVTFDQTFAAAPVCVVSPRNAAAAQATALGPYFDTTTTKLAVNFAVGDSVGASYEWAYHCIETN